MVTGGGGKERVVVIEWAEEGRGERAMAFTEVKYLKREVDGGEKGGVW